VVDPVDPDATIGVVADLCRTAVSDGGADLPVTGLWAGIAGAGTEPTRSLVEAALREAGLSELTAVGADAEAAFHDAFPSGPGILLISGTGSIALARGANGSRVRVGGWGGHLGDEGSGYGIGMSALRALARAEDGRSVSTSLRDSLLQAIGLAGPADLIKWVASARKADVASLVPLVCKAAEAGDEAATVIVEEAVTELVGHVGAVIRRLEPWSGTPEVALAGGLIQEDGPLQIRVVRALQELPCRVHDRTPDGARGACSLAMGLADQTEGSSAS
jgi:N-acetylglucosamine kinase-like BadF-type ATPase